ncbi:hypothetical protein B0F90DRAFT_1625923 [Multifurca ochricompacta]|uniref:NudC domain-containing protein 1 n=1 Tax=Multifurca ochricompacta TaxID=376703 RepID=A0AAD4QQ49_9AGAM|nr:hypothetical protein B0F90DRAFT_1625923 [Multifurca ochricompacta]
MFTLHPNRSLLNPKFDGYKLDPISFEDTIFRHVLQYKATQASVSGRHHFSFQEAQSRIRHNHLSFSPDGEQAVYVDADLRVISVRLNHVRDAQPSFRAIYDIPQPTLPSASDSFQREYPSSVFVDTQALMCADGHGTLYLLALSSIDSATLLGVYELPRSLNSPLPSPSLPPSSVPFRLHVALSVDGKPVVVLSFKSLQEAPLNPPSSRKIAPTEFDVLAVQLSSHSANDNSTIYPLDILWHRRGANVPFYIAYDKRRSVFILTGGSPYRQVGQLALEHHGSSPSEFGPIPRTDTALPVDPQKPLPYAWTQDSEEVTIVLPFPSSTSKANINVLFSPQTLTVLVENAEFPRYTATRLWGLVSPSSSFWTWDAHGTYAYGLLTLHLEKQHAGTRWPHVFEASSGQIEVPETLDPSELYAIRESLEKYTAALQEGGATRPSLADGEVDEEVDTTIGMETCITWVGLNGTDPKWAREDWDVPFTVLSTPLPGISTETSMTVKHAIDGLFFVLSDKDTASGLPVWTHESTYSALAFVLASKRDTRFTYHVSSKAVLALEGGGAEYGGNLYMYREAKPKSNLAKQAILKLTGDRSGSLLGVGAIRDGKQTAILCLCEKELVVLRNVL